MKKSKKPELQDVGKQLDCIPTYGVYGLLLAFVVVSVVYACYVVWVGTSTWTPKIMLVPQAVFAAFVFIRKFIKK